MVPTLNGRIQSRLFLMVVVGGLITLVIVPVLPGSTPIEDKYRNGFLALISITVLGVLWEFLYHFLMQWRWEKDWPTLFGLVTGVPEGLLVWLLLSAGAIPGIVGTVSGAAFVIQFTVIWLGAWLVANGPMRVPFIRWRFNGGRLV